MDKGWRIRTGVILAGLAVWTAGVMAATGMVSIIKTARHDGRTCYRTIPDEKAKDTKHEIIATGLKPCASEFIVDELNAAGAGKTIGITYDTVPNGADGVGGVDLVKRTPKGPELIASCFPPDAAEKVIKELETLSKRAKAENTVPADGARDLPER